MFIIFAKALDVFWVLKDLSKKYCLIFVVEKNKIFKKYSRKPVNITKSP